MSKPDKYESMFPANAKNEQNDPMDELVGSADGGQDGDYEAADEESPGFRIGREVKLGLTVLGGLLVVLGVIVVYKMAHRSPDSSVIASAPETESSKNGHEKPLPKDGLSASAMFKPDKATEVPVHSASKASPRKNRLQDDEGFSFADDSSKPAERNASHSGGRNRDSAAPAFADSRSNKPAAPSPAGNGGSLWADVASNNNTSASRAPRDLSIPSSANATSGAAATDPFRRGPASQDSMTRAASNDSGSRRPFNSAPSRNDATATSVADGNPLRLNDSAASGPDGRRMDRPRAADRATTAPAFGGSMGSAPLADNKSAWPSPDGPTAGSPTRAAGAPGDFSPANSTSLAAARATGPSPMADGGRSSQPRGYASASEMLPGADGSPRRTPGQLTGSTMASASSSLNTPRNSAIRNAGSYDIQPNDSYAKISQRLYGTDAYYQALAEYNRGNYPNESKLRPGDTIRTPTADELARLYPSLCPKAERRDAIAQRNALVSNPSTGLGNGRVYVVQEGDNLYNIARHELGKASRWAEIYDLNRDAIGKQFDYLTPGMRLALPTDRGASEGTVTQRPETRYNR
jgi:nucleoid-associated protein YgaU